MPSRDCLLYVGLRQLVVLVGIGLVTTRAFLWHPHFNRKDRSLNCRCHSQPTTNDIPDAIRSICSFVDGLLEGQDTIYTREQILQRINQRHANDCNWSKRLLAAEAPHTIPSPSSSSSVAFEEIRTQNGNYLIACRSLQPVLDAKAIVILRQAAEAKWQSSESSGIMSSSRFTYQRPGNYEAHIADLGPTVQAFVNDALQQNLYPVVRQKFWNDPNAQLCVYDALYIRYNATEAQETPAYIMGAGQPLHRDLGIVSVNVMLNHDEVDFVGGGTFFENQLRDDDEESDDNEGASAATTTAAPLKPLGVGHALAHYSGERHAGAATRSGVRDILVIFITAQADPPPVLVQGAMLKQSRSECECGDHGVKGEFWLRSLHCRLLHQNMAVSTNPDDGEALQYLANTLVEYADYMRTTDARVSVQSLEFAQTALERASTMTPCDARIWNTLGRTLSQLAQQTNQPKLLLSAAEDAYRRGIHLLERSQRRGCDIQHELHSMRLNYGLHLANLDRFLEASVMLEPLAIQYKADVASSSSSSSSDRLLSDSYRLYEFCRKEIENR